MVYPHVVRYLCADVFTSQILEELPLTGVTFDVGLNAAGTASGTLNVEDPHVRQMSWLAATIPNRTFLNIDIDGQIAWNGPIVGRPYTNSKGAVQVKAQEPYGYLAQRLQPKDYGAQWATTPTDAASIARTVLTDALAITQSMPIAVVAAAVAPSQFWVTLSAPISQRQTVSMIVSQLTQMGYLAGCDLASDPIYVGGKPIMQITLSYPARGRPASAPALMMDLTDAIDWDYDEDGLAQANGIVEMLSGTGGVSGEAFADGPLGDGFPLLEASMSHPSMSSTPAQDAVVEAFITADLALRAYPPATMTVEYPLFDDTGRGTYPSWGDWIIGDEVLVTLPPGSPEVPANPRFPTGLNFWFRIVKASVTIADQGVSTVKFTLNMPPSTVAVPPPGL